MMLWFVWVQAGGSSGLCGVELDGKVQGPRPYVWLPERLSFPSCGLSIRLGLLPA